MQKEQDRKILYYSDELNDDFAGTNIEQKKLPEDFEYVSKNFFFNLGKFLLHWLIVPIIWLLVKIIYHQKYVNKRVLKRCKKSGYFVYGNHTNWMLDVRRIFILLLNIFTLPLALLLTSEMLSGFVSTLPITLASFLQSHASFLKVIYSLLFV